MKLTTTADQNLDRLELSDGHVQIWFLRELICGPGSRLAALDCDCCVAIIATIINLLSNDEVKRSLIKGNLLPRFINLAYPRRSDSADSDSDTGDGPDAEQNLLQCRKATLKTLYSICSLSEFSAVYSLETELVKHCVELMRKGRLHEAESDRGGIPVSAAAVILASLTQSEETAISLIEKHKVHEHLWELLREIDDEDVLYPIISLVGRLALPTSNKAALVECGLLGAMYRFFDQDTLSNVQREAIIAVRRLITGSPQILAMIRTTRLDHPSDQTGPRSPLARILALFGRTDDTGKKIELGRLNIEICRILWTINSGSPEKSETEFILAVSPCSQEFADAIAFVALHGEGPGARGEGWFGFAMMSVWHIGRELVISCLGGQGMLVEVKKVVASGSGPGYQNLRLVLAKMNDVPVCTQSCFKRYHLVQC